MSNPPVPGAYRDDCPFVLCDARVWIFPSPAWRNDPPDRKMVALHDFRRADVTIPATRCPASLMYYPLAVVQRARLAEQIIPFQNMIDAERTKTPPNPSGSPPNESGPVSGRGPTLGADDPAWQRGGRDDPDIPGEPQEGIVERPPLRIVGPNNNHSEGKAMSEDPRSQLAAWINRAGAREAEALTIVNSATEKVRQAVSGALMELEAALVFYNYILAQGPSPLLEQAVVSVTNAEHEIKGAVFQFDNSMKSAANSISTATETNQEYIATLFNI